MIPVATVDTHLFVSPLLSSQAFPASVCYGKKGGSIVSLRRAAILKEEAPVLGFLDVRKKNVRDSWLDFGVGKFVRRCSQDWGSEGGDYAALEAEVLEFMKSSEDPESFPSRKKLISAGRRDLVEGILRIGGWMAIGWDLEGEEVLDSKIETASSSGRSLETAADDDSGIEGLLSRLKRERNLNPGTHPAYEEPSTTSKSLTVADIKRNSEPASVNLGDGRIQDSQGKTSHFSQRSSVDGSENSRKPDDWRTWSAQRTASSLEDFEAGEIIPEESRTGEVDDLGSEALQTVDGRSEHDGKKTGSSEAALSPIRIRFRKVESELSGVLSRLKSSSSTDISHKASESSCDDEVLKLYDDLEFRETEIMHHKDKLRSTRAKLAIMEGRMALAVIDAQRLEEQKRKSASSARKALQFLSTVYLSWTNKATEVLVTGSFDGWATKRKMNMSKTTGVFSLYMKLYPGKYEIKFIVDGEWKVDVLRPTVEYRGYVNNVLIVY